MLPHVDSILGIVAGFVIIVAMLVWLGMLFQNLLFQRYRLQKNESAMRKARLFDAYREDVQFRNKLLGEVKSEKTDKP
jgi:tetrahydromethanopterin S-methyltransferase subunit F